MVLNDGGCIITDFERGKSKHWLWDESSNKNTYKYKKKHKYENTNTIQKYKKYKIKKIHLGEKLVT